MDDSVFVGNLGHFILVVSKGQVGSILEILSDVVVPVESYFNTRVFYITAIDGHCIGTEGREYRSRNQPVSGIFVIPVEFKAQAVVQEACIDTEIQLLLCFPGKVRVGQSVGV